MVIYYKSIIKLKTRPIHQFAQPFPYEEGVKRIPTLHLYFKVSIRKKNSHSIVVRI